MHESYDINYHSFHGGSGDNPAEPQRGLFSNEHIVLAENTDCVCPKRRQSLDHIKQTQQRNYTI